MKHPSAYTYQDLIVDSSFIDWVKKGQSPDAIWGVWYEENPVFRAEAQQASALILNLHFDNEVVSQSRIDKIKSSMDKVLDEERSMVTLHPQRPGFPTGFPKRMLVAAVISLVLLSTVALLKFGNVFDTGGEEHALSLERRSTERGQKLTVFLNDGSQVKLNSESSIRYQEHFSDTARIIYLEGEAFFEVAKDSLRPFRVITDHLTVTALGTAFNVNTKTANSSLVSLVEGKVAVDKAAEQVLLKPGQQTYFSSSENRFEISDFDYELNVAWKDGVIHFKDASKEEVFSILSFWYGVDFQFNEKSSAPWTYSGKFDNESLENVLMSIGYVKGFEYQIMKNKVIITSNP